MSAGLHAEIELSRGSFGLRVAFDVEAGTVLAVLGPNGSGKSSLLGCLSGLLSPDRATITLDGRALHGLRPHARAVGLLSQDPLLFPHLSVLDNVAFSPRSKGAGRARAREIARHWLDQVGAAEFADRRPAQLSGGQAQRVGLARALAGDPDLLLLDEPLAALDVDAAPAVRGVLRRMLDTAGTRTTVLVTHDPLDALALADQVLVLADGQAVERGPARTVLAAPRTAFTARIAGLNLVAGTAIADGLRTVDGSVVAGIPEPDAELGKPAVAVFAPSAVSVYPAEEDHLGSPRNTATVAVAALEPHGAVIRLRTTGRGWAAGLSADLTPAAVADLRLEPGATVRLSIKATSVTIHPAHAAPG